MKHIVVDYHYVCEKVLRRDLCVRFVSGKDNLADMFTKPLPSPSFLLQHCKLLLDASPSCLRGDVNVHGSSNSKKQKGDDNGWITHSGRKVDDDFPTYSAMHCFT